MNQELFQEMMQALRDLTEAAGDLENDGGQCPATLWDNLQACIFQAEQAIAKAEGRS